MTLRPAFPTVVLASLLAFSEPSSAATFNYTLNEAGPLSSTGTSWIALPASMSTIATCADLKAAIDAGGTGVNSVISEFDPLTDTFKPCASIVAGRGYQVRVLATSSFSITGTDAAVMLSLPQPGSLAVTGRKLIGLPFCLNITQINPNSASGLIRDIGLAKVQRVERLRTFDDVLEFYTGRVGPGQTDFPLNGGEGYRLRMITSSYYTPPVTSSCTTTCASISGTFLAGKMASQLDDDFCAASGWPDPNYSCTPNSPAANRATIAYTGGGTCASWKIKLTFSGATTVDHPFGYQACCNSPLSNAMGMEGDSLVSLDDTSQAFGEITVSSVIEGPPNVPTLGTGMTAALVGILMAAGAFLVWRSFPAGS